MSYRATSFLQEGDGSCVELIEKGIPSCKFDVALALAPVLVGFGKYVQALDR